MVHDGADVPAGPASLDSVDVRFDERRLVSDAGLLLTASLADRLGIEETVNESVWLDPRAPGAALPGRKVLSLVHGMVAGADSIDDMNVLRAGSTGLILGHRVMAPSTLGTFLRAFTFGHVRQLDRVLDVALARAWEAGAGPGDGPLVIDLDSFIGEVYGYEKQGAGYGYTHKLGYHPIIATRADTGEVLHIRNRKGKANTQRGAERFVDELLARVRRAGHSGLIVLRADSGFENHKLMRTLDRQGVEFSIGVKQTKTVKALIDEIPETDWSRGAGLSRDRRGADRRDEARHLAADRAPHPARRRASRAMARLAPPLLRDQPHRPDPRRRHRSPRSRQHRAHDPRPQGPGTRALPLRPLRRQQRLDGDRRPRAQPRALDDTDRPAHRTRPDRPHPPPTTPAGPRTADPHQPPMDTAAPHRGGRGRPTSPPCWTRSGRSPLESDQAHTNPRIVQPTPRPTPARAACHETQPQTFPRERRQPITHRKPAAGDP